MDSAVETAHLMTHSIKTLGPQRKVMSCLAPLDVQIAADQRWPAGPPSNLLGLVGSLTGLVLGSCRLTSTV